jgi:hypothetical protein
MITAARTLALHVSRCLCELLPTPRGVARRHRPPPPPRTPRYRAYPLLTHPIPTLRAALRPRASPPRGV